MELEAEVANLKEENQELRKKQVFLFVLWTQIPSYKYKLTKLLFATNSNLYVKHLLTIVWLLQAEIMEIQKNQVPFCVFYY